MISRDTVLVLGAGASRPYGFPTGYELREQILARDRVEEMALRCRLLEVTEAEYLHFADQFRDSGLDSIDSFLGKQVEKQPALFDLGKRIIALYIGRNELPDHVTLAPSHGGWYRQLWNAMAAEIDDPAKLVENRTRIITFNYDRSLEFFLFKATKNAFFLSDEEAFAISSKVDIHHVYGDLGKVAVRDSGLERAYQPPSTAISVTEAARNITLMSSTRNAIELKNAIEWFKTAHQVCFLGFGFDNQNVIRLGFAQAMSQRFTRDPNGQVRGSELHIYSTVKGIPKSRIEQIRNGLLNLPNPGTSWTEAADDISTILPHWNCLQ
jgi:hypothetical protein